MTKFPLVGMSHRFPANPVLALLPPETELYLVREPDNQYDPNAIQVWIKNAAEVIGEDGVEAVKNDCLAQEKPCPDLTEPFQLGYIKAQTIDDEHLGADQLAPRIDAMVAAGEIAGASDIPVQLVYGSTGRPHVTLAADNLEGLIDTTDAENEDLVEDDEDDDEYFSAGPIEGEDYTSYE